MKWTDEKIKKTTEAEPGMHAEITMKQVRDDTIDECCKVVCAYCREGMPHFGPVPGCSAIRKHFRET